MEGGGREDSPEVFLGHLCVLESGGHELQLVHALKPLLGERRKLEARLDRRDVQTPVQEAAGQLSGPTADLEHRVTAFEAGEHAGLIDQLLRIRRPVPVVLGRHLIEDLAVAALQCSVGHGHKLSDAGDGGLKSTLKPGAQLRVELHQGGVK